MFLLFLIGLGTAHVNAQVRIGGNAAPNGAAVLDLNATDAATGTKGLALPRVNLTSNTMQITTGVANLNGMMVYNTTATLGAGIYSWIGGVWKRVDGLTTSPADSGFFMMSNGVTLVRQNLYGPNLGWNDTLHLNRNVSGITWTKILDTVYTLSNTARGYSYVNVKGMRRTDLCFPVIGTYGKFYTADVNQIVIFNLWTNAPQITDSIRCFRASA